MTLSKSAAAVLAAVKPAKKKCWEDYLPPSDRALLDELLEASVSGSIKVPWAAVLDAFCQKTKADISLSAWKDCRQRYRRSRDAQRKG